MNNYRIYFDECDKPEVIGVLRKHNDIIIDNIVENSVGITIERDDSDAYYSGIVDEIDQVVYETKVPPTRPDLI
jgi:hypothetical protein